MRQSHLILSNAVIMWATQVLLLVPQLIFVPYLIGTIGEAGYGVYALIWSLMVSIDQLEKSLQSGVVKYSAGFQAHGRIDEVNKVVSSSFVYSILLAMVASTGILVGAAFYEDPSGQIGSALVVVAVMMLFITPLTPYIAVIQSKQRYYVGSIAETLAKYLSLMAVVAWFHMMGPSVEALIIITAAMLFLSRLAQVPIAYHMVSGLQNSPRLFDWVSFRLGASFGAVTVLVSMCLAVNSTGVRWLMGTLVSTHFVAHMAIMLMPGILMYQINSAISLTVMPATSAYEATNNLKMLEELLVRGMCYTMILALAGLLAASLLMKNILSAWVGARYTFLAPYALALFTSGAFMQSTSIAHHMLKGLGKLWTVLFIYSLALVIVPIGLIIVLFQLWRNPYLTVTVSLGVGQLVCGFLNILFCAKAVRTNLRRLFLHVYGKPLLVAAVVWLIVVGIVALNGFAGPVGRIFIAVLAIALFLSGCYAFITTAAEHQQLRTFFQIGLNKVAVLVGMRSRQF